MAPSRPSRQNTSFPVFLLAGVLLLFALGLEVVRVYVFEASDASLPIKTPVEKTQPVLPPEAFPARKSGEAEDVKGNVFDTIHTRYPTYKTPFEKLNKTPLEWMAHNPSFGPRSAPVVLDVFTDTDCVPCRQEVNYVLEEIAPYMENVRIIYRFIPARGNEMRGGVFDQIARRAGVFTPYFKDVMRSERKLAAEDYLLILEKHGLDLMEQRRYMSEDMRFIVADVKKDVEYAKHKNVFGPPQFFLNGYLLGQEGLPVADVAYYTARLKAGRTIIPEQK